MKNIGFIGAGRMATALASGITSSHPNKFEIHVADPNPAALSVFKQELENRAQVTVSDSNQGVVEQSEVLFLAVKPQLLNQALRDVTFDSDPLLISVVAGKTIESLQAVTGCQRVVRVMPNTPCLIGMGASGYAATDAVSAEDLAQVRDFLDSIGVSVEVRPDLIDAVTGVSGSGPAYVFTFLEALIDGGVLAGLPRDDARTLAIQTVLGAAELVQRTGQHPAQLRDQVTSPGGTTIAGMKSLEHSGFRDAVMSAVQAATRRAQELG